MAWLDWGSSTCLPSPNPGRRAGLSQALAQTADPATHARFVAGGSHAANEVKRMILGDLVNYYVVRFA